MKKKHILWVVGLITNNGRSYLPESDPCYHIAVNMIKLMQNEFDFSVLLPPTAGDILPDFPIGVHVQYHKKPIHYAYQRFHFDFQQSQQIIRNFNNRKDVQPISIMMSDDNTHVANWRAVFHSLGVQPKIVSLTPFVDYPNSRKVEKTLSYHIRQMESFKLSDAVAFQSYFNLHEAISMDFDMCEPAAIAEHHKNNYLVWPWGYSQKEIDRYKMSERRYTKPTVYFTNRITDNANRYNNYHKFAMAVKHVRNDGQFWFTNPTGKATQKQIDDIHEWSGGRAIVNPNSDVMDRVQYMTMVSHAHISMHLFTHAHRGMSHDEAAAMGKITISTASKTYLEFWNGKQYPFLVHERLDPIEIAEKIDMAIESLGTIQGRQYMTMNQVSAAAYSYENVSKQVIADLKTL